MDLAVSGKVRTLSLFYTPLSLIAKPSLPLPCPCAQHSLFRVLWIYPLWWKKQCGGGGKTRYTAHNCVLTVHAVAVSQIPTK
eukprot:COSAG06_NODE_10520_length_1666_cov_3.042757_1_plen_82_part_00